MSADTVIPVQLVELGQLVARIAAWGCTMGRSNRDCVSQHPRDDDQWCAACLCADWLRRWQAVEGGGEAMSAPAPPSDSEGRGR